MQNTTEVLVTVGRFLTFRSVRPDLTRLGAHYVAFAILSAWLAGIGRYWDNPRAELWQFLGLGSVAYLFVLSVILWLLIMPLRPANWSFKSILVFVGMTSPLAFLYAIPVERFMTLRDSQSVNVWFLAIVATWRVVLLFLYFKRSARFRRLPALVATLLPLAIIVSCLTVLNLEHVVFRIMGGLTADERSSNDAAYAILWLLSSLSLLASPVLLITYIAMIASRRNQAEPGQPG